MHTLSLRAVRGAACLAIALSAWAAVQAKTSAEPVVVPARHVKPVATKTPSKPRTQATPAAANKDDAKPARSEVVDTDGSRFRYDSCGCSSE